MVVFVLTHNSGARVCAGLDSSCVQRRSVYSSYSEPRFWACCGVGRLLLFVCSAPRESSTRRNSKGTELEREREKAEAAGPVVELLVYRYSALRRSLLLWWWEGMRVESPQRVDFLLSDNGPMCIAL